MDQFKPWRIFLDTSVLLTGVLSIKDAAHQIIKAGEVKLFEILISSDVLIEADRNFEKKFPDSITDNRLLVQKLDPTLVDDPTDKETHQSVSFVGSNDAPILAAAIKSKADFLVTWNTRDFMTPKIPKDFPPDYDAARVIG